MVIFRPFKVGDYIEGGGVAGVVQEIQIFTSLLKTPDNKLIIVPNSGMMGGNIVNYSAMDTRRIDLVAGVRITSYNVCYTKLLRPSFRISALVADEQGDKTEILAQSRRNPFPHEILLAAVHDFHLIGFQNITAADESHQGSGRVPGNHR